MRIDQVISAWSEPARIAYASVFPAGVRAMLGLQRAVDVAGLEPLLLELVKMRASQINGCAHCLDMHSKDARALGESEQRRAHIEPYPRRPAPRRARRNARQSRR
jgi:AhpD family alkylhydroperoxidase